MRFFEYVLIALLSALISGFFALLLFSPVFCGAIILSPIAGVTIAEIEWRITLQRVGSYIRGFVAGGLILGGLLATSVTAIAVIVLWATHTSNDLALLVVPIIPIVHTALCTVGYWFWSKWRRRR